MVDIDAVKEVEEANGQVQVGANIEEANVEETEKKEDEPTPPESSGLIGGAIAFLTAAQPVVNRFSEQVNKATAQITQEVNKATAQIYSDIYRELDVDKDGSISFDDLKSKTSSVGTEIQKEFSKTMTKENAIEIASQAKSQAVNISTSIYTNTSKVVGQWRSVDGKLTKKDVQNLEQKIENIKPLSEEKSASMNHIDLIEVARSNFKVAQDYAQPMLEVAGAKMVELSQPVVAKTKPALEITTAYATTAVDQTGAYVVSVGQHVQKLVQDLQTQNAQEIKQHAQEQIQTIIKECIEFGDKSVTYVKTSYQACDRQKVVEAAHKLKLQVQQNMDIEIVKQRLDDLLEMVRFLVFSKHSNQEHAEQQEEPKEDVKENKDAPEEIPEQKVEEQQELSDHEPEQKIEKAEEPTTQQPPEQPEQPEQQPDPNQEAEPEQEQPLEQDQEQEDDWEVVVPPEYIYSSALLVLREMGFDEVKALVPLLNKHKGDVAAVCEAMLQ